MAQARNDRGVEEVRRDLEHERDQLASAADDLRENIEEATDIRGKLPVLAGGALLTGFILAGGIGATARLIFRRGREHATIARIGPIRIVED